MRAAAARVRLATSDSPSAAHARCGRGDGDDRREPRRRRHPDRRRQHREARDPLLAVRGPAALARERHLALERAGGGGRARGEALERRIAARERLGREGEEELPEAVAWMGTLEPTRGAARRKPLPSALSSTTRRPARAPTRKTVSPSASASSSSTGRAAATTGSRSRAPRPSATSPMPGP